MFDDGQVVAEEHAPHKVLGQVVSSNEKETIVAYGGKRIEYYTSSLVLFTPRQKQIKYPEFDREITEIISKVEKSIKNILLSPVRINKHKPFTWKDESENEHLRKAIRHILTYQLQRDNQEKRDTEQHLDNAITRLAMAIGKK